MKELGSLNQSPLILLVLLLICLINCGNGQESERFIDVRKIIKGALDVMRTYPAPSSLLQPLPTQPGQTAPSSAPQPAMAIPLPISQQQPSYYPQNSQPRPISVPYRTINSQNPPLPEQNQQQPPIHYYTNYPAATPSPAVRRIFAEPTQKDMEKLFHLPADIISRLAADAGYVEKDQHQGNAEPTNSNSFGQGFNSGSGEGSGFKFNVNDNSKAWGMAKGYDKNQESTSSTTTTTRAPAIVASGNPRILMRSVNREGKIIQVPVVAIPQANGEIAYIPFERLSDLSDALSKLVSTGQISVDDIFSSSSQSPGNNDPKSQKTSFSANNFPTNPLIDSTNDAIATNQVPSQTMRKIFPVKDLVYPTQPITEMPSNPSTPSILGQSPNREFIMIEPPTTTTERMPMTLESLNGATTQAMQDVRMMTAQGVEEKNKKVVMTESKAFVQEVDEDEENDEKEDQKQKREQKGKQVGEGAITGEEILLNGKRYKLVGEGQNAEDQTSMLAKMMSRMLKSTPTQVPLNGKPIPLTNNESIKQNVPTFIMGNNNEMVNFDQPQSTNPTPTPAPKPEAPFRVSQQQQYPALAQQNEMKFQEDIHTGRDLIERGVGMVKRGEGSVQVGDEAVRRGVKAVELGEQHASTRAGNKDVFVHQPSPTVQLPKAQIPQEVIYPVYAANSPQHHQLMMTHPLTTTTTTTEMPRTESKEQLFIVNNGPFGPIPVDRSSLGGPQVMKKSSGVNEMRKKEEYQIPLRRQYSLKELEAFYNAQKNNVNTKMTSNQKVYLPQKEIKIGMESRKELQHIPTGTGAMKQISIQGVREPEVMSPGEKKMSRLEKLRKQFARERATVARRTKHIFMSRINSGTREKRPGKVTEQHCQNIRSFARQFGTLDLEFFAKNNCRFIETYYPELKCSKVDEYVAECQKYSA